jgi:septum formation protein
MTTSFIYLASASPRRAALLEQIGVPFRVLESTVSEVRLGDEPAEAYVERVAAAKANEVWGRVAGAEPAPVLGADTAVVIDAEIFGKPGSEAEALETLTRLSGRSHRVLTAVALRFEDAREALVSVSEVRFRATTEAERVAYCRSGEPFDKAGSYAIQGLGGVFVEHLSGSFASVMGLPLLETTTLLGRFGMPPWLRSAGPG